MRRAAGIAGLFVVALALAPIGADAQVISACVNNSSGVLRIVAQGATCHAGETPLNWNAVGIQGPKGDTGATGATGAQGPAGQALASRSYYCTPDTQILSYSGTVAKPLTFNRAQGFGSSISDGGTNTFTNFILQPGVYQLHMSGSRFLSDVFINSTLGYAEISAPRIMALPDPLVPQLIPIWKFVSESGYPNGGINSKSVGWDLVGGDRLLEVRAANTTLQMLITNDFIGDNAASITLPPNIRAGSGNCQFIITQLK